MSYLNDAKIITFPSITIVLSEINLEMQIIAEKVTSFRKHSYLCIKLQLQVVQYGLFLGNKWLLLRNKSLLSGDKRLFSTIIVVIFHFYVTLLTLLPPRREQSIWY